jgi:hypothetical protein
MPINVAFGELLGGYVLPQICGEAEAQRAKEDAVKNGGKKAIAGPARVAGAYHPHQAGPALALPHWCPGTSSTLANSEECWVAEQVAR